MLRFLVFVGLACLASALPKPAEKLDPISRSEVVTRAECWVKQHVKYSQEKYWPDCEGHKYRTDCSGMTSMSWRVGVSYTTRNIQEITHNITKDEMRTGDAFLSPNFHIAIFEKWANDEHTEYWAFEECCNPETGYAMHRIRPIQYADDPEHVFFPVRFNHIVD